MSGRVRGFREASIARGFALAAILIALSAPARAELACGMRLGGLGMDIVGSVAETPSPVLMARVDISAQTMQVFLGESLVETFPVSTGRMGYGTPVGDYQAQWLATQWRSKKYHNAPMPWSVFFHGGYAIHGTTEVWRLGRPASHGCVRLHPDNAKIFFQLVRESGLDSTRISIVR